MDIAVCGAQVPFMRGGAELHMENLVAALIREGHRAELVRLPVAWDRTRLFDAPLAWRLVPIDADLVIATNFPSYYVRHPRKVVWLFHQHRGAYDAVGSAWSDFGLDDASLEDQRRLTEWDARVLGEAERLFSTSGVVADRLARYNGLQATPLYHPPPLHDRLRPGPFNDYVLCPTRLEANKRPDLVIEGLAHATSNARAVLAGSGTLADELEKTVKRLDLTGRIELAGFVPDDELIDLYASCCAVVYPPFDEDYGYVTLQAFLAGKPVITTADSGGVLEWVEDGVTGIVTDGSPESMGTAIDRLVRDPDFARRMGEAGHAKVHDLDWGPVVDALVNG